MRTTGNQLRRFMAAWYVVGFCTGAAFGTFVALAIEVWEVTCR